jgi:hypothetical protein
MGEYSAVYTWTTLSDRLMSDYQMLDVERPNALRRYDCENVNDSKRMNWWINVSQLAIVVDLYYLYYPSCCEADICGGRIYSSSLAD